MAKAVFPAVRPQAFDDAATTDENTGITIDVMANDLGAVAKWLYSVDQLHPAHAASSAVSAMGAAIRIVDGRISYDPTAAAAVQALAAGATAVDTFRYAIRLADGTISVGSVSVSLVGMNDAASITGTATGAVTEDGTLTTGGTLTVSDVDAGENTFAAVGTLAGAYGSFTFDNGAWTYALDNTAAAVQALGGSATVHDTLVVQSKDGTASHEIKVGIAGTNDAAVIGAPGNATVTEDSGVDPLGNLVASGTLSISDPDQGEGYFQTATVAADGNLGQLTLAADGTYTYSVSNSAVQFLDAGHTHVDSFTVTSGDGTSSLVEFTIAGADDARFAGLNDGTFRAAYLTGSYEPWGTMNLESAMNSAFGAGQWYHGNADTSSAILQQADFVYLDGGDGQTAWFEAYIGEHRAELEDFVEDGGTLYVNAARWYPQQGLDLGFGAQLWYSPQGTGTAANPGHELFTAATGTRWTGTSFSHDYVVFAPGVAASGLIRGESGLTSLAELSYGQGHVLFGGITSPYFHQGTDGGSPQALLVGILEYTSGFAADAAV